MKSGDNAVLDGVYNINKWIEANKASFQPPICNKLMYVALQSKLIILKSAHGIATISL